MRSLVQPLPSMHCNHCNGELRFKMIVTDNSGFDRDVQVFVCAKCGREHSRAVAHDQYNARSRSNMSTIHANLRSG